MHPVAQLLTFPETLVDFVHVPRSQLENEILVISAASHVISNQPVYTFKGEITNDSLCSVVPQTSVAQARQRSSSEQRIPAVNRSKCP